MCVVLIAFNCINLKGQSGNDTVLVINEIFYNPPNSSDDSLEFIEVYNGGSTGINVNGFRLKSPSIGTSSINVLFPNITIPSGGYIVLAADSLTVAKYFGVTPIQWNSGKLLNNTSKDIVLFDAVNKVIDSVTYFNTSPWPSISSSGGPSIELLNPFLDNTIGTNWEKSKQPRYIILGQDTLLTVYCSPGQPNINQRPVVMFSSDKQIVPLGETVTFTNESVNYDSLSWTFTGSNITHSNEETPQVVYNNYGMFDVSLYVSNEYGDITLNKPNYIIAFPTCGQITSLPYQTNFATLPECWFSYPPAGDGSWQLDDSIGHNDSSSLKFDCAGYNASAEGTVFTRKFDVSAYQYSSLSFYYCCPGNSSVTSKAPVIIIHTYNENYEILQTKVINATKLEDWALFTLSLSAQDKFCSISVKNKTGNNAVYIDDFILQDRIANSSMISGKITDGHSPLSGILVKFQPGNVTSVSDGNGNYSAFVENGWSGTVMPANMQYLYTPNYFEIINIQHDTTEMNFVAAQLPDGWIFSQTANSHTFCVPYNAIDTNEITLNSWIGVFYVDSIGEKHCCGAVQINDENTTCFNAWAANPNLNEHGFTPNTPIYWKIYEVSSEKQFDAEVGYASGPEVFTIDGITILNHIEIEKITQIIIVPTGWTGISSYVIPFNPDLQTLLEPYSSDIVILINDSGSFVPGVHSNLKIWDANRGWLVKTTNTVVLSYTGKFNPDLSVNFDEGWTLFPIKSNIPVSIDSIFGVTDKLDIIKGYGTNEIYIPGITSGFNLKPGKAYKAHFNSPYTVNFKENKLHDKNTVIQLDSVEDLVADGNEITPTSIDHVVLMSDRNNLQFNDTILVFSPNGLCCGFGAVSQAGQVVFKVFGDDPTSNEIDGLIAGEKMIVKLIRNNMEYTMTYAYNVRTINHDIFVADGFTYIDKINLIPSGTIDYLKLKVYTYPNPVSDLLFVCRESNTERYRYQITDIFGRVVFNEVLLDTVTIIDMRDIPSGIYLMNFISPSGNYSRKIVKE